MFERRTAYFVAMPMLFGIKGNLDMTLASRLTSALHSGMLGNAHEASSEINNVNEVNDEMQMERRKQLRFERKKRIYTSSLALLQVQAIVCGIVAGILTLLMSQNISTFSDAVTIVAAIVVTAMVRFFRFSSVSQYLKNESSSCSSSSSSFDLFFFVCSPCCAVLSFSSLFIGRCFSLRFAHVCVSLRWQSCWMRSRQYSNTISFFIR